MTDDLRARIADALRNLTGPHASGDPISYEGMADAVVRELGLRREVLPSGGVTEPVRGSTWFRQGGFRWVTEWVPDE